MRYINLVGETFGKLYVKSRVANNSKNGAMFLCECDCGGTSVVPSLSLRKGYTTSCGCYREEFRSLPDGVASMNDLFYTYRAGAKKDGRVFELTIDEFKVITSSNCVYCGTPPSKINKPKRFKRPYRYNGVDRRDNSVGYTRENVQPCCYICNQAKHTLKEDVFLGWIENLINFNRSKK